jgi:hypothetical protein
MALTLVPDISVTPSQRPVRGSCAERDDAEHPHRKKISVKRIRALNITAFFQEKKRKPPNG